MNNMNSNSPADLPAWDFICKGLWASALTLLAMTRCVVGSAAGVANVSDAGPAGLAQAVQAEASVPDRIWFVSPAGDDASPGTAAKPFRSLTRAREAARAVAGTGRKVVFLRQGIYELTETLALDQRDSHTSWCAFPGERVRLAGGKTLPSSQAQPVTDPTVLARLVETDARPRVRQVDLHAAGITDFGQMRPRGFSWPYVPAPLELSVDGQVQHLAQWPNRSEPGIPMGKVLDQGSLPVNGDLANRGGVFLFETHRPDSWAKAEDVWITGLFNYGFADDTLKVAAFDLQKRTIQTVQPHLFGFKSGSDWNRWMALNLLEELDQPGEYFCDTHAGILYFIPPVDYDEKSSELQVSVLEEPMVALEGAEDIRFVGITFECARGMGVYIERGRDCRLIGCTLRNIGTVAVCVGKGVTAVRLAGNPHVHTTAQPASRRLGSILWYFYNFTAYDREAGTGHGVQSCDIYNIGAGGIHLGGGNRVRLDAAGNFVDNCDIHHVNRLDRSYKTAVNVDGVGNAVTHCRIHDLPACALLVHGNDHRIEYNEVFRVVEEGNDMGALYFGRDPSEFGILIRHNFFHHVGGSKHSTFGVYCDDCSCGVRILGNVFYRTGHKAATVVGGGKYHEIKGNVFVNDPVVVEMDNRGQVSWSGYFKKGQLFEERTRKAVDITSPVWAARYPKLAQYWQDDPRRRGWK